MTEKPFLERWASRKAAERKEAAPDPEPAAAPPEGEAGAAADAPAPRRPAEPISEEELAALPPVESLVAGADIRAFLRPGVPAALKNAALRRMWLLTPAIRDHKDVAVDYAWDWNTPGGVPGSGGTIDPAKAAEWMRQLGFTSARQKPADALPESPAETPGETPPETSAEPPTEPPTEPPAAPAPVAVRLDPGTRGAEGAAASAKASEPRRMSHEGGEPAVRPRHGSARPE